MKKILILIIVILIIVALGITAYAEYLKYIVTASYLNVRESRSIESRIVGGLPNGSIIDGENVSDNWTLIKHNNETAYVCSKYIRLLTDTSSTTYTPDELNLLARLVNAEAGSDWLSDEHQKAVASVVINRVADSRFPNTIKGVVYQRGQYACISSGMINYKPSQRAIENAKYVLENGVTIPTNVVWQSQFIQGKGVWKYIQGHYFCY